MYAQEGEEDICIYFSALSGIKGHGFRCRSNLFLMIMRSSVVDEDDEVDADELDVKDEEEDTQEDGEDNNDGIPPVKINGGEDTWFGWMYRVQ